MTIDKLIDDLKKLIPDIQIHIQPETSLNKLLEYEKLYNINSEDALELYIKLDEEIHFNEKYSYLSDWISQLNTYKIHNGDEAMINHLK